MISNSRGIIYCYRKKREGDKGILIDKVGVKIERKYPYTQIMTTPPLPLLRAGTVWKGCAILY